MPRQAVGPVRHARDDAAGRYQRLLRLLERIATVQTLRRVTGLQIVGQELRLGRHGDPDQPSIALLVPTENERAVAATREGEIVEQVRLLLVDGGYPLEAARTAEVVVASRERIAERGVRGVFPA